MRASPTDRPALATLLVLATLATASLPAMRHLDDPYENDYHGSLTAWFALMSQNMEESGFLETRLLPPLNPNRAEFPDFRYYVTHPVLDVVTRAALIRTFGPDEWVVRLQGLLGCAMAAGLVFLLFRRVAGRSLPGAVAAVAGFVGVPIYTRLAHLSMHHPMTLACGVAAFVLWRRYAEKGGRTLAWGIGVAAFAGMNFDWPGYFAPAVIALDALPRLRANPRARVVLGMVCVLPIVALGLFWFHVDVIGGEHLLQRLRDASNDPLGSVEGAEWWRAIWNHQLAGYGPVGIALMLLAPFLALVAEPGRRLGLVWLWLLFLAYGAANIAAFPQKAPREDFWGCYWLPLSGISCGIAAHVVGRVLCRSDRSIRPPVIATAFCAAGALGALFVPWNEAAANDGARHARDAARILKIVPHEDRGIFVTDHEGYEEKVLLAYLRVNLLFVPPPPAPLDGLDERIKALFFHVRGARILFFLQAPKPGAEAAWNERRTWLQQHGTPYRGIEVIWDLTDYVW